MAGFGAFGKIPAVGDFFRLSAPPGFVSGWDAWLQGALLAGQSALGAAWDSHYMSAPIWRFALAAGLAGRGKVMGVLMPSVDRVGRRFPLTLMAALDTPGPAPLDHFREAALFARLEEVALAALDDAATRDTLESDLAAIPAPQMRATAPLRQAGGCLVLTQSAPGTLPGDLAAGLLAGRYTTPSLWSAEVAGAPRMMICEGLPDDGSARGLFDLNAPIWSEARPI
ncbi:MAG: type VI secretion system-associated protein TagF [Antarcticimicrobium sp.]|uniref:type VI secretion system-associated protein TagF n=1 Tax=Antarcticimicrobium sp. TaxID=2824147 RepID=UPI00262CBFE5|nr:type VI secretion system-associated protein TagF [Antarcticimicrobium sp.]MDF1718404.1 type VI secretion system-associated protein TagF [Antarcticimicrobium sp.]